MSATCENTTKRLLLEGDVTIYTIQEIKQLLLDSLENGDAVEADLSGVREFDSAGLQVLILAWAEAIRTRKRLSFVGASPAVKEVMDLCDMNCLLDGPCAN